MIEVGYVVVGLYVLVSIWLLVVALMQIHLLWHAGKNKKKADGTLPRHLPFVSVQVPVYNERYVIEELLYCLSRLDYPKHLYEIQVLDDSTDDTSSIIDHAAAQLKKQSVGVHVVRRNSRAGYKAGALQHGLPLCKGELIAIFDADFRPPAHFIKSLLPHFLQQQVGLVQARWGHLNRDENNLTQLQSILLDTHFTIEQNGRYQAGYFINFCGTAGIWRKECIADAGGWDGAILSEDLDLSYRAQLKGWKIVFEKDVVVPAEVPPVVEAFKVQQFRWTKGIAQTARKTLQGVWKSSFPFSKKLHSFFQLASSFVFVCLLFNALLTLPLLVLRQYDTRFVELTDYTAICGLNLVLLTIIYYQGVKKAGNQKGFFFYYPIFIVVYLAMSVQNTVAVLEGILGKRSPFVRTPKLSATGTKNNSYLNNTINWLVFFEMACFIYFFSGIVLSFYYADYFLLLFFFMMCSGLLILLYPTLSAIRFIHPSGNNLSRIKMAKEA
jgi:cellulose synthase/poly-beta-1,6-N-acetylglucosamine synthase-like glycosyltransferase